MMIKFFNNFSLKRKNIIIILAMVLFSILISVIVLGVLNIKNFRNNLETKIEAVAKVVGDNTVVAVDFGDKEAGQKIIDSLNAIPEVVAAVIYHKDGREFVSFKNEPQASFTSLKYQDVNSLYEGDYLYIREDVGYYDEKSATLFVIASTRKLNDRIVGYLMFSSILMVGIFVVAAVLGSWLTKKITSPILILAHTAETISAKGDYSIRVKKKNNDEIGILYDSFNDMLDRIAAKDLEIRKLNESLEDKVLERTLDLVKAKEQAENARQAAELADRAKSTFLANMSHEIRTPMNAILGYSRLLMKMSRDETKREYLQIVQTSGKNLLALINDILDLSKIESGKLNLVYKPINIDYIVNEIQNIFKIKKEKKEIDFIISVRGEIPAGLLMDESRLRQILFNVVGNAVKFTDEGYVKLAVSREESEAYPGKIHMVFNVEDTGIGIREDDIESIFDAFEQQKNQSAQYGGTGLGLAITKRLVEIMNGEISLISTVGIGTVFTIRLKDIEVSEDCAVTSPVSIAVTQSISFKGNRILLVEDNHYNLKLVHAILEDKDIAVTEAVNGKDALEKLKILKPDLILMDLKMPVMDGYQTTSIIKSDTRLKNIPLIAFTADIMKDGLKRITDIGCNGFLPKPIDESKLTAELMKHLEYTQREDKETKKIGGLKDNAGKGVWDISQLSPESLAVLSEELTGPLSLRWKQLGDSMLLDDWVGFANTVEKLGERHNAPLLTDYGKHIVGNVTHLNIVELKKTIKKFPEIVDIFREGGT
ncbi:MAG: response regulator [bacterium]|nr:response regulator [bacterium]